MRFDNAASKLTFSNSQKSVWFRGAISRCLLKLFYSSYTCHLVSVTTDSCHTTQQRYNCLWLAFWEHRLANQRKHFEIPTPVQVDDTKYDNNNEIISTANRLASQ